MTDKEVDGFYSIAHWDYSPDDWAPSIVDSLKDLRDNVEKKLAMVHEGTTVHTEYLMFLEQLDGIIEQCKC